MDKELNVIENVCAHFPIAGRIQSIEILKSGNINQTYCINVLKDNGEQRQYILQSINQNVFPFPEKIISNVNGITEHLKKKLYKEPDFKRLVMRMYQTHYGESLYLDGEGRYWRLLSYIFNSQCINTPNAYSMEMTGIAFGRFQAMLSDYPIETLYETIKDFHNTEKRIDALRNACLEDKFGRLKEIKSQCDFLLSLDYYASYFRKKHEEGIMPLRVTHNDTKCNNVMFDKSTCAPLAVIDLDTVMPGYAAHDFGDAIRFGANNAAEDEEDLSKVFMNLNMFEAFTKGFLSQVGNTLTDSELESFPIGVIVMTMEVAARFFTDYLKGDVYFTVKKAKHNYYRGMAQTALVMDQLNKLESMNEIMGKYTG